jgi:rod shape-determining protein MreD
MSLDIWTWPERAGVMMRLLVPYAFIALFFLLDLVPVHIPPFGEIRPCFSIMSVFYWAIYRPTLIPNWFVFLLGLTLDLVSGLPLGLNAFVFLLVYWVISDQRRVFVGQPFVTVMIGFALVLSLSNMMRWFLFSLVSGTWPPLLPIMGIIVIGLFIFPLINMLLHTIHKILPEQATPIMRPRLGKLLK